SKYWFYLSSGITNVENVCIEYLAYGTAITAKEGIPTEDKCVISHLSSGNVFKWIRQIWVFVFKEVKRMTICMIDQGAVMRLQGCRRSTSRLMRWLTIPSIYQEFFGRGVGCSVS